MYQGHLQMAFADEKFTSAGPKKLMQIRERMMCVVYVLNKENI